LFAEVKLSCMLDEVMPVSELLVAILARVQLPVEVDGPDVTRQTFPEIGLEVAVLASVLRHHVEVFVVSLVVFLDVDHEGIAGRVEPVALHALEVHLGAVESLDMDPQTRLELGTELTVLALIYARSFLAIRNQLADSFNHFLKLKHYRDVKSRRLRRQKM
jgi:hypothetical protein